MDKIRWYELPEARQLASLGYSGCFSTSSTVGMRQGLVGTSVLAVRAFTAGSGDSIVMTYPPWKGIRTARRRCANRHGPGNSPSGCWLCEKNTRIGARTSWSRAVPRVALDRPGCVPPSKWKRCTVLCQQDECTRRGLTLGRGGGAPSRNLLGGRSFSGYLARPRAVSHQGVAGGRRQ